MRHDLTAALGLLILTAGVWLLSPAAALIVLGVGLVAAGWLGAWAEREPKGEQQGEQHGPADEDREPVP